MTIPEYIALHKLSRRAFAERVGVSPSRITDWLENGTTPDGDSIRRVVEETNGEVTANEILGIGKPRRVPDPAPEGADGEPETKATTEAA
jgi:transcriptional regulator with XRE-family HTH domain